MKTPRLQDFDPNAPRRLGSPLDNMPAIQKPQPTPVVPQPVTNEVQAQQSNARTPERLNGKRIITRNSFEVYEDQMDTLRELAYHEKRAGKLGSMSAMVREAIDTYLKTRPRRRG